MLYKNQEWKLSTAYFKVDQDLEDKAHCVIPFGMMAFFQMVWGILLMEKTKKQRKVTFNIYVTK